MQSDLTFSNFTKRNVIKVLILPILILVVGVVVSIQVERKEREVQATLVTETLKKELLEIKADFTNRLTFYVYGLKGLHSLISTIGLENFRYETMQTYAQSRDFQAEFPGMRGMGFIDKVEQSELQAFLKTQRTSRPSGEFDLRQLSDHQQSLFIIRYVEPEEKNRSAVGLDIGSESIRREAAIASAQDGKVHISAPITLVQANQRAKHGFLLLTPFYNSQPFRTPPQDFMSTIAGWVYAPILIDEVLAFDFHIGDELTLFIADVTDREPVDFYASSEQSNQQTPYISSENMPILGREWKLSIAASPQLIQEIKTVDKFEAFYQSMFITFLFALTALSVQLISVWRKEAKNYGKKLLVEKEKALQEANVRLEHIVEERTAQIARANSFQQAILISSSYAIIATDDTGNITVFNPAAEKLLKYSAQEVVGRETPALFHLPEEIINKAKALTQELSVQIEPGFEVFTAKAIRGQIDIENWTYIDKDQNQIQVMLSVSCLRDQNNDVIGFLGMAFDLTEQLLKEKALADSKEIAEQATKVKSEFLANMSHEIRTPLNGIFGTLQLLSDQKNKHRHCELIDLAKHSTSSLSELINDILDFSRLDAGKLELSLKPVDLNKLLANLQAEISISVKQKDLDFNYQETLDCKTWLVDALRIRQILLNVLTNAIKFTHKGNIGLSVEATSNGVRFVVSDTGIGMNKATQDSLFERFEQGDRSTTREYGGSGLGMPISRFLIELMQGKIRVNSEEGVGTRVEIYLPLVKTTDEKVAIEPTSHTALDLSDYTILVAEDNEINQIVIQSILQTTNANIHVVDNGLKALELLPNVDVDLILMDIQMPVMDGSEACKRILLQYPDVPIVAVTANVFDDDIALYKQQGFVDCIAKPYDKLSIIKSVEFWLNNPKSR